MFQTSVPLHTPCMPLKQYLRQYCGISLTSWRKIKHTGNIRINEQLADPNALIAPGDKILIKWSTDCTIEAIELPLSIAYEDEYILIIDKPPGLLVHPATFNNAPTLANGVMYYYKKNNWTYGFHPIHRLDRNTSGLILIAKLPFIQHLFSINKLINRFYQAVVSGNLAQACGTINVPIARHPDSIITRIVDPNGKSAITNYKVLSPLKGASLIELELLTGRTHQIRVHMSHIHHPLLGDDLYGGSTELINRQALHAARVSFVHPITKQVLTIISSLPPDMSKLITLLKA